MSGPTAGFAQEIIGPIREMFTVDAIEFTGNRKVESEAIQEKIGTRADMVLDNYLLRKDLSRMLGLYFLVRKSSPEHSPEPRDLLP